MDPIVIAVLVAAAVAGNIVLVRVFRRGGQRRSGLREMAEAQGRVFTEVKATGRQPGHLAVEDPAAGWRVQINSGGHGQNARHTVWTDPSLAAPEGLAVYMPPLPEKTQAMFNALMDKSGMMGRAMLNGLVAGLGPEAANLRAVEDDDPATLLAVPGAEALFDALKGHPALPELDRFGRTLADVPVLARSAAGFSRRINKSLDEPEALQRFIETGLRFAALMRGAD